MTSARSRSLVVTIAVSVVVLYLLAGHGLLHVNGPEGMAGAAASLCLVLVTVLGCIAVPKPEELRNSVATASATALGRLPEPPPVDGRARASPAALQRFRN